MWIEWMELNGRRLPNMQEALGSVPSTAEYACVCNLKSQSGVQIHICVIRTTISQTSAFIPGSELKYFLTLFHFLIWPTPSKLIPTVTKEPRHS